MREIMYDQSSVVIVMVLLLSMIAVIELGFRIGARWAASTVESSRSQVSAIQASLLGVLGLLLAFTLSLALQRFIAQCQRVVAAQSCSGRELVQCRQFRLTAEDRHPDLSGQHSAIIDQH